MNRRYISTLYTSELILKMKMTSSNVFPAQAVPVMSALTMTPCEAFSFTPARPPASGPSPHTVSYLLARPVSPSLTAWPVRSQGELKVLQVARLLRCPVVLGPDSSGSAPSAPAGQVHR